VDESSFTEETGSSKLNGMERCALFLLSVGKDRAKEILKHMNPKEVQTMGGIMASMKNVDKTDVEYILKEYFTHLDEDFLGIEPGEFAKNLMTEALGEDGGHVMDATLLGEKVKGLESLKWMHPSSISKMLENEHPQVMAIVLSYFDPEQSAEVLKGLPKRFQSEVIFRIATLTTIQPRALMDLNEVIQSTANDSEGGKLATIGGEKRAAEILNLVGGGIDQVILDDISSENSQVSESIQDLMFVFDDVTGIDSSGIQEIIKEVDMAELVVALKGSSENLKKKFLSALPKRQASSVEYDLNSGTPIKLSEVEAAQRSMVATVRKLADEGRVIMPGGGEEFI
jgi:flagellar motor switch protein FliG